MDKIDRVIVALKKKKMLGFFVQDRAELLALLSELILSGETIGCGDSVSLEQLGVFDFLRKGNYNFLDKHEKGLSKDEKREIYLKNFTAGTFISGANAITENGEIFNIDGNGSRVAPMLYGPRQVIIVVGKNKIVTDAEQAIIRARQIAAPLDAKRLNRGTPCAKAGKCTNCSSNQRICNDFVLIAGQFDEGRIKVIIVNQELGY